MATRSGVRNRPSRSGSSPNFSSTVLLAEGLAGPEDLRVSLMAPLDCCCSREANEAVVLAACTPVLAEDGKACDGSSMETTAGTLGLLGLELSLGGPPSLPFLGGGEGERESLLEAEDERVERRRLRLAPPLLALLCLRFLSICDEEDGFLPPVSSMGSFLMFLMAARPPCNLFCSGAVELLDEPSAEEDLDPGGASSGLAERFSFLMGLLLT